MNCLQTAASWPRPIVVATIRAAVSAIALLLLSLPAVAQLHLPTLETIGFPMQVGLIFLGIFCSCAIARRATSSPRLGQSG